MLQTIPEKIKQRRAQMLIHSCVYYHLNDNLIPDHIWQKWADELHELQRSYVANIGFYDEAFKGWTGSSGFALPLRDSWVLGMAEHLIRRRDSAGLYAAHYKKA